MAYSKEMVYRAFALFMDYVRPDSISRILRENFGHDNAPSTVTVKKWAKEGDCTEGISWYQIREMSDPVRGKAANDRQVINRRPTPYDQWKDETMVQLEEVQETIRAKIKTGELDVKASDMPRLIQSRQLLEGEATSRIEHKGKEAQVLGQIIRAAIGLVQLRYMGNKEVKEAFRSTIDYISEEFARFANYKGDPDTYEIRLGSEPGSRQLRSGS
jgi:hypothetical protein